MGCFFFLWMLLPFVIIQVTKHLTVGIRSLTDRILLVQSRLTWLKWHFSNKVLLLTLYAIMNL